MYTILDSAADDVPGSLAITLTRSVIINTKHRIEDIKSAIIKFPVLYFPRKRPWISFLTRLSYQNIILHPVSHYL